MNTTIDHISATRKSITVTVPADLIRDEEARVLKEAAQKIKIPGFRPGKVPVSMLKTKFAKGLDAELQEKIMNLAFKHLAESMGEDIIYSIVKAEVQGETLPKDGDATLIFLVDVKPSFNLPEYKGVQIKTSPVDVLENEIQQAVETVLKEHSEYVLTDEAAKVGDYVKVSYEGSIKGQLIADLLPRKTIYGTQKSTWEQAGAKDVPGVSAVIEGIVGMKAGDKKTVTMHFPEDFQIKELAGQAATYEVSVEEVRNLVLPEIDQALFAKLKVESIDQLRDQIKEGLSRRKNDESKILARNKIIEHLLNSTSFDIPESAIKDEENALIRLYMTRMMDHGLTNEQVESKRDEIIDNAQKEAPGRAKTHMLLYAIAKQEKIELNDQDLNMAVMYEAYKAGMKPQQFVKHLQKDRKLIADLRQNALFNKVLDFLYKESKVEFEGNTKEQS